MCGFGCLVSGALELPTLGPIGLTAPQAVSGVAWLPWRPLPQFLTAGRDGLLLWSLQPSFLEQRCLTIPDLAAGSTACTALATAASSGGIPASSLTGKM